MRITVRLDELLHEVRHLAQVAYAARVADHEPPGRHDVFYFTELA